MRLSENHILRTLILVLYLLIALHFAFPLLGQSNHNKISKNYSSITFWTISELLLELNRDVRHGIMRASTIKNKLLNISWAKRRRGERRMGKSPPTTRLRQLDGLRCHGQHRRQLLKCCSNSMTWKYKPDGAQSHYFGIVHGGESWLKKSCKMRKSDHNWDKEHRTGDCR